MQEIVKKQELVNNKGSRKKLAIGLGILAVVGAGVFAYYKYTVYYPSTNDAYVNANLVDISPKVGGFIKNIRVKDNQFVKKGDILFDIDPQDYGIQIEQSTQNVNYAKEQSDVAKQNIAVAQATIAKAQSDYNFNQQTAGRYAELFEAGAASKQDMQKYLNTATQSKQQLEQAKLTLAQAKVQYQATISQIGASKAALNDANNRNGYTNISAPVDGYIAQLGLAQGQLVQAGQNLFGLVDDSYWWIDTNFKETQIDRIKIGQKATVALDMYDHKYKGTVESISRASGNTFSLLPAQNATGNWVKVTQRFTVRVRLEDDPKFPLRVGASADVTIDTTK